MRGEATTPEKKRDLTRTERRAGERSFVATGYRTNKARITQTVANDRGTLPDARELAKIAKARKSVNEQLTLAKAKAAHPAGTKVR